MIAVLGDFYQFFVIFTNFCHFCQSSYFYQFLRFLPIFVFEWDKEREGERKGAEIAK
jgi:hypothetical protein